MSLRVWASIWWSVVAVLVLAACSSAATDASRSISAHRAAEAIYTAGAVKKAFAASGISLRQISISPSARGQVDLVGMNPHFSLGVFIYTTTVQAKSAFARNWASWSYNGGNARRLTNVNIVVGPVGSAAYRKGPRVPIPHSVYVALDRLKTTT